MTGRSDVNDRRELIFYATPTGELADECRGYFDWAAAEPTTAQTYPPHITLTGFFRRTHRGAERATVDVDRLIDRHGHPPAASVTIDEVRIDPKWVGLVISSQWLIDVTADLVGHHALGPGDDALRPKDWLHLSLAYGVDDLSARATRAAAFDAERPGGWQLGLYERHFDGTWSQLR